MKKILILTNNLNGGGAERVLLTILNHLNSVNYKIDLCLVYNEGVYLNDVPSYVKLSYIFEHRSQETSKMIKEDTGEIYNRFFNNTYDIEIAFLEGNATRILSKSTNRNALKLAWVHLDLSQEHYTQSIYNGDIDEQYAFSAFNRIIFVSSAVQRGFERLFGTAMQSKSLVLYNPIDAHIVAQKASLWTPEKSKITFCAIGRLVRQKGFDRLLNVAYKLKEQGFQFEIWLLGEGKERAALDEMLRKLDLKNIVKLLGFQLNPYPYLKNADAFICASRTEGLSVVMGEALVLGTTIISTDCSGAREALQDGKFGTIVENNEDGIYKGLYNFLKFSNIAGKSQVNDENRYAVFNLDMYMSRLLQLFELTC